MRPRLLDLFSGVGGAARGYQQAGWHVTGVDILDQPRYAGDEFVQGSALEYVAAHGHTFDAIHASPPCQASSSLTKGNRRRGGWADSHYDLIPATRALLDLTGVPYVIENVQGSVVRRDLTLCGEMFDLEVIRHRYCELGRWSMSKPVHKRHRGRVAGMRHGQWFDGPYYQVYGDGGGKGSVADWQRAMGIDWTDVRKEIAQAIPPAYGRFVGAALLEHIALNAEEAA